jgi:hypothetical protein
LCFSCFCPPPAERTLFYPLESKEKVESALSIFVCLTTTDQLKRISGLRKQDVCRFVRAVVGITPQNMSDLVRSNECWSFSIAFDGATAQDRSLLNVRLRQLVAVASRTCTFWLYRCGSLTPAWAWPSSFIRL